MITVQIDIPALAKEIGSELEKLKKSQESDHLPANKLRHTPFALLRLRVEELGYDCAYFARKLNMSKATMSSRMTGKRPWLITEMYAAMDLLMLSHDKLHEYFPKNGYPKHHKTQEKGKA